MLHRVDRELFDCAQAAQQIEQVWNSVLLKQAKAVEQEARQQMEDARSRLGELSRVEHR